MRRAAALAVAMMLVSAPAAPQQQVSVAAAVPVASPTGGGARNLTFGTITPLPGTTQTIDVIAAAAPIDANVQSGEFRFGVAAMRGLDFNISAPAQLTAPGAIPLGVSFDGAQYGAWCVDSGAGCTLTNFNPAAAVHQRVCAQTLGNGNCHPSRVFQAGAELAVYVGGALGVPSAARAGIYTGTITLTIVQVF